MQNLYIEFILYWWIAFLCINNIVTVFILPWLCHINEYIYICSLHLYVYVPFYNNIMYTNNYYFWWKTFAFFCDLAFNSESFLVKNSFWEDAPLSHNHLLLHKLQQYADLLDFLAYIVFTFKLFTEDGFPIIVIDVKS